MSRAKPPLEEPDCTDVCFTRWIWLDFVDVLLAVSIA
jgi:hypothetical protein